MRYKLYNHNVSIYSIALLGCFLVAFHPSYVYAEKYFTWVDEMGRVNHTVIPEEENPLIQPENNDDVPALIQNSEQGVSQPTQAESLPDDTTRIAEQPVSTGGVNEGRLEASEKDHLPNSTPDSAPAVVVDRFEDNQNYTSPMSSVPKVEINEDDYIDGDVLLQQGNIRDESDLPYYTWTDEQGIVRNTPYRPESSATSKQAPKNAQRDKVEIVYTVYDEYRRFDQPQGSQKIAPQKIDSFAQQLFFDGKEDSFINKFSTNCCQDLPKESPSALDFEDSVYVEVDKNAESYLFSEGKSPFKLIELPSVQDTYSLKLKTFVKTSGKTGVKNGVFFPQIVFLDDQYQVLRIIRNPVLEYVPENWRRHGYLKGLFEIDGRDNERYILINTTKENLKARNRIENKTVVLLSNQKTGSFEIEALKK